MTVPNVLLILGAGANIGAGVARAFLNNGYKIALASRRFQDGFDKDGTYKVQTDLAHPDSVRSVFDKVTKTLGIPTVVVYNASIVKWVSAENPFELSLKDYEDCMAINTTSYLAAAKAAVEGFERLPASASRTVIFTGNITNTEPIVPMLSSGVGKSGSAHITNLAALAYHDRGFKFYYADERKEDGKVAGRGIDGDAHGEFYLQLAQGKEQGPWLATFVKGKGYVPFPGTGYLGDFKV